jgi:hypothetical protein
MSTITPTSAGVAGRTITTGELIALILAGRVRAVHRTKPHVKFVGLYEMAVGAGLIIPGVIGWQTWLVPVCALLYGAQPVFDVRRNRELDLPTFGMFEVVCTAAAVFVAAGRTWIAPL